MYKPVRQGVVHDPGRTIDYGDVTSACQYTFGIHYTGSEFKLVAGDTLTTCVLCLRAAPGDRGVWPPPVQ